MKKITLLAFSLFGALALQAQTITQTVINTAEYTTDAADVPVSWAPDPGTIELTATGFPPNTLVITYNQVFNAANEQIGGGRNDITTDASGNGVITFNHGFFNGFTMTADQVMTWNTQVAGGAAAPVSQVYPGTLATLGSKLNSNKLAASFYSKNKGALVIGDAISGDYSIYDITGKTIKTGTISNEISVVSLASGVYILSTEAGFLKFIK